MLSKESKIRILEGFYGLDYLFFDAPITSIKTDHDLAENYLVLKSALLSMIIEMFGIVDHKPVINEIVDSNWIHETSKRDANAAKRICKKLVVTEDGRADVKAKIQESLKDNKNLIQEVGMLNLIENEVEHKSFSLAVDTLLIAKMLKESKNYLGLTEGEGLVIEDGYKLVRNSLVEVAQLIREGIIDN